MIKSSSFLISTYLMFLPMLVGCGVPMFSKAKHTILSNAYGLAQRRRLSYNSASLHLGPQKLRYSYSKGNKGYQSVIRFLKEKKERKQYRGNDDTGGFYSLAFLGPLFHFLSRDKKESNLENNLDYLTRASLLAQVKGELDKGEPVVIYGESGAGKTCLAKDFVKKHKDEFFSILWINADTEDSYFSSLQQYASKMGMKNLERNSAETLKNFIKNCLEQKRKELIGLHHLDESFLSEGGDSLLFFDVKSAKALANYIRQYFIGKKKVLIVYDNLDSNEPFLSEGSESLFFCDVNDGNVIITSRKDDWGSNYKKVKATDLTIEEIKTLFTQQKLFYNDYPSLEKMAQLLEGKNILTIRLMVFHLLNFRFDFKEFLMPLSQQVKDIRSVILKNYLKELEENNKDIFSVLSMLGYLAPDHIAEEFLNMLNIEKASETMRTLFNFGLLNLNRPSDSDMDSPRVYSIHRKVQESIRNYDASHESLKRIIAVIRKQWCYKLEKSETWEGVRQQYTHINRLWKHAIKSENKDLILDMLPLMNDIANYAHYVNADIKQAERILEDALKQAKKVNKRLVNKDIANIYLSLAKIKIRKNLLDEGISDLEKALKCNIRPLEAQIFCSWGEACIKQNKFELADKNLKKAENFPDKSAFIASMICCARGWYAFRKTEYKKALTYLLQALDLIKEEEENYFYKAHIYNMMFGVYFELNQLSLANEYLEKSKEVREQNYAPIHPLTAAYYNNKGLILKEKEQYDLAIESFKKASKIKAMILPLRHPSDVIYHVNLGRSYLAKKNYKKAREAFNQALEVSLTVNGQDHHITAWQYVELGTLAREEGEYEKACKLIKKCLEMQKGCLPVDHIYEGDAKYELGHTYKAWGYSLEARETFKEALGIFQKHLGPKHKKIKNTLTEL